MQEAQIKLKDLWHKWQRSKAKGEEERAIRQLYRREEQKLKRIKGKARSRWVKDLAARLDQATLHHDMGRFYNTLRQAGIYMMKSSRDGEQSFTNEEAVEHLLSISDEAGVFDESKLQDGLPKIAENVGLGATPSRDEVRYTLLEMRDTSAGPDEVTVGMIRSGGIDMIDEVITLLRKMWDSDAETWEETTHEATGVLLYKGKGGRKVANHRMIVLISVVLRAMARIVAKRLSSRKFNPAEDTIRFSPSSFSARSHLDSTGDAGDHGRPEKVECNGHSGGDLCRH